MKCDAGRYFVRDASVFLHCVGDSADADPPVELENEVAARIEAVQFAAELIRDESHYLNGIHNMRIEVSDVERRLLITIAVRIVVAPKP